MCTNCYQTHKIVGSATIFNPRKEGLVTECMCYSNDQLLVVNQHEGGGSGTVPLLELFWWNAINIREFAYSHACFTLCGDKLTTAHGLYAARSVRVCRVSTVVVHACV